MLEGIIYILEYS